MDRKTPNIVLKNLEFLRKIRNSKYQDYPTCFLSKLNQDGSIPINFWDWDNEEFEIVEEKLQPNWKILKLRLGKSRSWGVLLHPNGYTIEIHAQSTGHEPHDGMALMDIIENYEIKNGIIIGDFRWFDSRLYNYE